jgi:hypothetical protein
MNYSIICSVPTCRTAAVYKVAAVWSDGLTQELKTYALCCGEHVHECLADACRRRDGCPLEPGETLAAPGVYVLQPGQRDIQLTRRPELEV